MTELMNVSLLVLLIVNVAILLVIQKLIAFANKSNEEVSIGVEQHIPLSMGRLANSKVCEELTSLAPTKVLLFLNSTCPKCKEKTSIIKDLLLHIDTELLQLFIISQEPLSTVKDFLNDDVLWSRVFFMEKSPYLGLNPTEATPAYYFIEDNSYLRAKGLIGDETWKLFVSQVAE